MMIERVKGISQVNPVSLGAGGMGDRQSSGNGNSAFHNMLSQAMKPKSSPVVPETYTVDLNRVTHSLFYQGVATLDAVRRA